ncbi:MAG: hypothetical protein JRE71_21205 [Deltaproteobacteria bacterium]|nr:hypothetical protein [Deltaproteobacteria bacterium]
MEKRSKQELGFHAVLALNYALARQGRRSAVFPLIEALKETGHLGAVYLGWAFGYDHSWDRALWKQRVGEYTDASWAEFQRQRRLPRVPRDADLSGLREAGAWWDGLGLPDLGKTPFVRVGTGWIMSQGDEKWEAKQYGFLLREDTKSFTTLDTALRKIVWSKKSPPLSHREAVPSYERIPIGATLGEVLSSWDRLVDGSSVDWAALTAIDRSHGDDEFGLRYVNTRIYRAFVLARALLAHKETKLALRLWKRIAEDERHTPRYGNWSAVSALKESVQFGTLRIWEERFSDPQVSFREQLLDYKNWLRCFSTEPNSAISLARLKVVERMGRDEASYHVTLKMLDPLSAEDRVPILIESLAAVHGDPPGAIPVARSDSAAGSTGLSPLLELVEIGYPAVPALIKALDDDRYTRCRWRTFPMKSYFRIRTGPVHVCNLAYEALRRISGETAAGHWNALALTLDDEFRRQIRTKMEAWWKTARKK